MTQRTNRDVPIHTDLPGRPRTVKSADNAFGVAEYLHGSGGAGVTEIAEELGLSKGSVHAHLATLEEHGYVVNDGGTYRVGLRFLEMGLAARERNQIYGVVEPKLADLADETGERVWCVVEENGLGVFLCGATGEHAVKTDAKPGRRMHLHYLSGGKAILAHRSRSYVEDVVERYGLPRKTEHTVTSEEELFKEIEGVRERGYATDFEESLYGLHTVSSPILDSEGEPLAAITIVGAAQRMTEEVCRNELSTLLLATANEIELDIQYS